MLLSLNKAYLGKLCITLVGPSEPEILARQNKSHFSHLFFALNTELIFLLFFKKMQSEQKVKLTSACQNKTFYTKLQMHTVYIAYWLANNCTQHPLPKSTAYNIHNNIHNKYWKIARKLKQAFSHSIQMQSIFSLLLLSIHPFLIHFYYPFFNPGNLSIQLKLAKQII